MRRTEAAPLKRLQHSGSCWDRTLQLIPCLPGSIAYQLALFRSSPTFGQPFTGSDSYLKD